MIKGIRAWRVTYDYQLQSWADPHQWHLTSNQAPSPKQGRHVGFHAFKPDRFFELPRTVGWPTVCKSAGYSRGIVWGEVLLWGTVVEGERGYRAEFARPSALFLVSCPLNLSLDLQPLQRELAESNELTQHVADHLGLPVIRIVCPNPTEATAR